MGRDKASLPFGHETLLSRVIGIVSKVVDEVWVVSSQGQVLPALPDGCQVTCDTDVGMGPLAGLAAGLAAIKSERAFLTSCDVPLLKESTVRTLFELAEDHPAAVPLIDGHYMVTSGIYTRALLPAAEQLIREGRLRPLYLVQSVSARIVTEDELRATDPDLLSFYNCNTPQAYREALRIAGVE